MNFLGSDKGGIMTEGKIQKFLLLFSGIRTRDSCVRDPHAIHSATEVCLMNFLDGWSTNEKSRVARQFWIDQSEARKYFSLLNYKNETRNSFFKKSKKSNGHDGPRLEHKEWNRLGIRLKMSQYFKCLTLVVTIEQLEQKSDWARWTGVEWWKTAGHAICVYNIYIKKILKDDELCEEIKEQIRAKTEEREEEINDLNELHEHVTQLSPQGSFKVERKNQTY